MKRQLLEEYILSKSDSQLDYPFGDDVAVYQVGDKMFALIQDKEPLRISLRCSPELAQKLREDYESVLPGHNLDKKHWNTLILSGQLSDQQVFDLVDLSYRLASE